jgi:hypothetical protein
MTSLSISVLKGVLTLESIAAEWRRAIQESLLTSSSCDLACPQSLPPKQIVAIFACASGALVGLVPLTAKR